MREITKLRAKAVIAEIVRQQGGKLHSMTILFKAFWKSHVAAIEQGRQLTVYPIARLPEGPGIDNPNLLLGELMVEGVMEVEYPAQEFDPVVFHLLRNDAYQSVLSDEDRAAISEGIKYVQAKSARQVSKDSHRDSRSWNSTTRNGGEIDEVLDAMPEEKYQSLRNKFAEANLAKNWPQG